ncbi:hypothetical protein [Caballeronia sp. dw_276]|uniref:hypothetical protein n=1 Tax=Caballeronia sp. dw_276 TaxID=2719795 RepID=UPI001BD2E667|nr:hypothetical protein [Caballeronia sp. dw_276]
MSVPKGLWRLYGEAPFPRIQVLAGRTCEERRESLNAIGGADVLVVAGGLGELDESVEALAKTAIPCVFVLGPSDLRGHEVTSAVAYARKLAAGTDVYVLDRDEVVITGVRFLGATLWSSYSDWNPEIVRECLSTPPVLADIKADDWWSEAENRREAEALYRIAGLSEPCFSSGSMHPAAAYIEHRRALDWLEDRLSTPFDGFTVVVSSNSPTRASLVGVDGYPAETVDIFQFEDSKYRCKLVRLRAEANDLRKFLREHRDDVALWVHGLTEANSDLAVEGVRVVCRSGRRARVDDDLPIGELMARELSKHAPNKRRNKSKSLPSEDAEILLHPAPIFLEHGLAEPLSASLLPKADALSQHVNAVRGVIPHSMSKSSVHRACVRRVIYEELVAFENLCNSVIEIEGQLSDDARTWVHKLACNIRTLDCPKGYPTEMKEPVEFDYYATADRLDERVDVVRDIPLKASTALARWAEYAYVALTTLDSLGAAGVVVRPPHSAFRRSYASQRINIVVACSATELEALQAQLRAAHPRANELQPTIRLLSEDSLPTDGVALLERAQMKLVTEHIEVPPVVERMASISS